MALKKQPSKKVERLSPVEITKIAFGVRYEPQYAVMDKIGAVIDRILRSTDTPFGPEAFPLCHSSPVEYLLINKKENNSLRISQRDTILEMTIGTRNLEKFEVLAKQFDEYVLKNLEKISKLGGIQRFGVLFHLAECGSLLDTSPIEHYVKDFRDSRGVRSMHLRFTRRLPRMEAIAMHNVNDYGNVIYTVTQSDEDKVNILVDYQEYFDPPLDAADWVKKPYPEFVKKGVEYFQGEFWSWFNKLKKTKTEAA